MDEFEKELKLTFLEEAKQLLDEAEQVLICMEKEGLKEDWLDRLFRCAHSFKGGARVAGFGPASELAHKFEDCLSAIKKQTVTPNKDTYTVFLQTLDKLRQITVSLEKDFNAPVDSHELEQKLADITSGEKTKESPPIPAAKDFYAAPPKPPKEGEKTAPPTPPHQAPKSEEFIRISTKRLDDLINLIGELSVNQAILNRHKSQGTLSSQPASSLISYTDKLLKEVQTLSMSLRMLSIKPLFQKLERVARDTASVLKKEVELTLEGENVEVDKHILENLSEPLTHLMRNAVDHGVENPEDRVKKGKPAKAKLLLKAIQLEDHIEVTIGDDGGGINPERVKQKALEKGWITESTQLTEKEIFQFIFKPGFSTKEQVTEVSGRGVGLDVVQTTLDNLKGSISIESKLNEGTQFMLSLPLSLSILTGMIVEVSGQKYVIPISQLIETIDLSKVSHFKVAANQKALDLRGEVVPLYSLREKLHLEARATEEPKADNVGTGIILYFQGKKASFKVEKILGQQSILLKKLHTDVQQIPGILGGAILSDGEPGLVLNLFDFLPKDLGYGL